MSNSSSKILTWLVVVAGLTAIGWQYRDRLLPQDTAPQVGLPSAQVTIPTEPAGPQHPIDVPQTTGDTPRSLVPLPLLDDSDAFFLLEISAIFGTDIESRPHADLR